MKPSEFPGWNELELHDLTEKGDIWFKVGVEKEPNPAMTIYAGYGQRMLANVLVSLSDRKKFKALRRSRRLPLNPHFSEALPLP